MVAGQAGCATCYQHLLLAEGIISNTWEEGCCLRKYSLMKWSVHMCVHVYVCSHTRVYVCVCRHDSLLTIQILVSTSTGIPLLLLLIVMIPIAGKPQAHHIWVVLRVPHLIHWIFITTMTSVSELKRWKKRCLGIWPRYMIGILVSSGSVVNTISDYLVSAESTFLDYRWLVSWDVPCTGRGIILRHLSYFISSSSGTVVVV